eukprot:GSMAST32.ASY1.ANO1.266.1 assembled CDS
MASSEYPTSTIKKNDNINDSTSIIKTNDNSVFDIYDDNDVQSIIDLKKPHLQYTKTRSYGKRKIVLHIGPTNSGKTYEAVQSLQNAKSGIYCGPLRLLANEMYEKLNSLDIPYNLNIIDNSTNYKNSLSKWPLECAVIDEIQLLGDNTRGWAWTRAFLGLPASEIHLCGDPSIETLIKRLCDVTGTFS